MTQTPWKPEVEVAHEDLFCLLEAMPPTMRAPGWARFRLTRTMEATTFVRALCLSRPMTARIFEGGQLVGGGRRLSRNDVIEAGSDISLSLVPTRAPLPASETPVSVFYQDPFIMAVEKPSGILVHGDGSDAETLTSRVQGLLARQGCPAVPQALHRLDVETSGIVLFSLTEELQAVLDALVAGDGLRKRYYAVVEGEIGDPAASQGDWLTIDAPIARDRHDARRMRVGKTGKPSATRVRTLVRLNGRSFVEAELKTGRRHQIRVHLAYVGHPIVGDSLYGGPSGGAGLMLHAHEVTFTHPLTRKVLSIESDAPHSWELPEIR